MSPLTDLLLRQRHTLRRLLSLVPFDELKSLLSKWYPLLVFTSFWAFPPYVGASCGQRIRIQFLFGNCPRSISVVAPPSLLCWDGAPRWNGIAPLHGGVCQGGDKLLRLVSTRSWSPFLFPLFPSTFRQIMSRSFLDKFRPLCVAFIISLWAPDLLQSQNSKQRSFRTSWASLPTSRFLAHPVKRFGRR